MKLIENLKENKLEYLFYLLVFLLPLQTRWIFGDATYQGEVFEYGRFSLYTYDILLFILLVISFFNKKRVKIDKVFTCFGLFALFSLLSSFWADEKMVNSYFGIRMIFGLGLFYLVQKISFSKTRLATTVVLAGALQGLLGVWQFVNQGVAGSKWLGMSGQSARELGASVVEFGLERWLRAYGSLPHPNIYGALLVISFIGLIYLVSKVEQKYHKIFLLGSGSVIVLGILFSYSRAAWIGLGLALVFGIGYSLIFKDRDKKKFGKIFFAYLLLLIILFSYVTLPIIKTRLHMGETTRLETISNMERVAGYKAAKRIFSDNWLVGVGAGGYAYELRDRHPDEKVWYIHPVHNVPLLILVELGIIGLGILFVSVGFMVMELLKKRKWNYVGILLLLFILMMFDHFWWTAGSGIYILWLTLGIVQKASKE